MSGAAYDGSREPEKSRKMLPANAFDGIEGNVEFPYLQNGSTVIAVGPTKEMARILELGRKKFPEEIEYLLAIGHRTLGMHSQKSPLEIQLTLPLTQNDIINTMSVAMAAAGEVGQPKYTVPPLHIEASRGCLSLYLTKAVGPFAPRGISIPGSREEMLKVVGALAHYCK